MIVNSINNNLDLSHGTLSKSILTAAGDQIQTEIYHHIDSFRPYENIALTSGGKLSCLMIAHGVLAPFNRLDDTCIKVWFKMTSANKFLCKCKLVKERKWNFHKENIVIIYNGMFWSYCDYIPPNPKLNFLYQVEFLVCNML